MKAWGRLITAMVTLMHEDGSINYEENVRFAQHLAATGTTALVIGGTTGESPTVTAEEKGKLFHLLKKSVSLPIIAGVGTNSTATTIENIQAAEQCGVDGLLVVVPYYNRPNQESLYQHFKAVSEATDLPIMLYNVPGRTGANLAAETSVRLAKLHNIVALKEAAGDLEQLASVVRDTAEDFLVYTGEDGQIIPSLSVGAYGVVSVAANVASEKLATMIHTFLDGDVQRAATNHHELMELCQALFMTANPIPVKAAVAMLGFQAGPTRLPLVPADETVRIRVSHALKQLKIIG